MRRCSVLSTGQLHSDHIAGLERLHSSVTVDRRCEDLAELIAAARTVRADAALIIGDTQKLTSTVLTGLSAEGLTVVAISEVAAERSRLRALGIECFDDEVHAELLAQALVDEQPTAKAPLGSPRDSEPDVGDEFADLMATNGMHWGPEDEHADSQRNFRQHVQPSAAELLGLTVVWGAPGSPGRTTLAVNLAAELALAGSRCLLIDADSYASAVAVHLGLMQESAGLAQACRAAEVGRLDAAAMEAAATSVMLRGQRLAVLTGLPRAQRWTELRSHALEQVLVQARADYDHIIIDTAPWIEHDAEWALDFGGTAPQRNTAARTALSHADTILALGGADPVGFSRLVKSVQELGESLPQAPKPKVIVSQLRKGVIGRSPRRQLSEAWEQLGPGGSIAEFLPWDQTACDSALRKGQVLAEADADSALRRHIAALIGVELPARRRFLQMGSAQRRRRRTRLETAASRG